MAITRLGYHHDNALGDGDALESEAAARVFSENWTWRVLLDAW